MPFCKSCDSRIQSGRLCKTCQREDEVAGGWDAVYEDAEVDEDA